MPRGPKGEKRPADVIGNAVHVMRIATGEAEDTPALSRTETAKKGGMKGGKARAKILPASERQEIARKAASARWPAGAGKAASSARGKKEHQ